MTLLSSWRFLFVFQLLLLAWSKEDQLSVVWTGSKLGTRAYNMESVAIYEGKLDHAKFSPERYLRRRKLLCVVFIRASLQPSINLLTNAIHMGDSCDWAVIIYAGHDLSICKNEKLTKKLIHCKHSSEYQENSDKAIPKSVMYADLLPYLPKYQRVFLMDEDISLIGFDVNQFIKVWDCSFRNQPPPLIVQPLIAESNQYFTFVGVNAWKDSTIMATASGIVEQQVPAFNSVFFEWFVKRVLARTKSAGLQHGVDWGHDRSWCNAAKMYAREVLKWPSSASVCSILVGATPVHHMNTQSMQTKRENRTKFLAEGAVVVQKYINLFPTWVLTDILTSPNPMRSVYAKVGTLNRTCVRLGPGPF